MSATIATEARFADRTLDEIATEARFADRTLDEIATSLPGATGVFRRVKLDFFRGGRVSLAEAVAA